MADAVRNPQDVQYDDQTWPEGAPVAGEKLSANGRYCGQKLGTPTQDAEDPDGANADAYFVEHVAERFGTISQDKQMVDDGTFPQVKEAETDG